MPEPIVAKFYPQKSLGHIRNSPVHNWYFFTLGYSPNFVSYEIKKKKITSEHLVIDPFVGSGTTAVECKLNGIDSWGIDANDFMSFATKVKTDWSVNLSDIRYNYGRIINSVQPIMAKIENNGHKTIYDYIEEETRHLVPVIDEQVSELIKSEYISTKPLKKLLILKRGISNIGDHNVKDLFNLALAAILIPVSNVRFGPGFGLTKPKEDADVIGLFKNKITRMLNDIEYTQKLKKVGKTKIEIGDTRKLKTVCKNQKFDHLITSPPYPGDHEYTRHTRLELSFLNLANTMADIRIIKKRMLRGSTRNVYSTDKESEFIEKFSEITRLIKRVDMRVKETNGTSGFEKMYSKVVGEYFGGMYLCLQQIYEILETGGTASFLVGDSHAFKMVHIETARLLAAMGKEIGFREYDIELWWNKRSTAHNFFLPEYILDLKK